MKFIISICFVLFFSFYTFSFDIKEFKIDNAKIGENIASGNFIDAALLSLKWAVIFEKEKRIKESAIFYGTTAKSFEMGYRIDEAINNYQKGIYVLESDIKLFDDKKIEKLKYIWTMNIGLLTLYYKSDLKTSKEYLDSAYQYFDLNNYMLEKGIVIRGFGVKYKLEGDKEKAFEMFDQSISLLINLDKKEYFNSFGEKLETYLLDENTKMSIQSLEKLQSEVLAINDPKTTIRYFLTMSKLSSDLRSKKTYLTYCENNLKDTIDINLKINVLLSIANVLMEEENVSNYPTVIEKYSLALDYAKKVNNRRAIFNIQNQLGNIYYLNKEYEKCYLCLNASMEEENNDISLSVRNTLSINLGISLYYLNRYDESIKYLESSLEHIEKIRKSIVYSDGKSKKFFSEMESCYEYLTLSYIKTGKLEEAFNIYELSKARSFLNNLSIRSAFNNGGVSLDEIELFNQYVKELNILEIKMNNVNIEVGELLEIQKKHNNKIEELEKYILSLEKKYPKFSEIRNPKILTFVDAKGILKSKEAIVAFFVSAENYLFIVKRNLDKPVVVSLPEEVDKFSNMLINSMFYSYRVDNKSYNDMLTFLIKENAPVISMADKGYEEEKDLKGTVKRNKNILTPEEVLNNIKNLYGYFSLELFRKDFLKNLVDVENIFLCPDGSFWTMPIEALIAKDPFTNDFFIFGEKYNVMYIQSMSTIAYLNNKNNTNNKYDNSEMLDIIAFAGAKYPYVKGANNVMRNNFSSADLKKMVCDIPEIYLKNSEGRNQKDYYYKKDIEWKELGYAKSDLLITGEIFKNKSKLYGGSLVSEERIKYLSDTNELAKAGILYFSLHGYMDSNNPYMSSLVLSLPQHVSEQEIYENKIVDDGYLNASEILTLKLNNPFVILSACETGTDKIEGGEGVAGICQSFFVAGAKSVLATLWSIDEKSSYEFMKMFLTKIKAGEKPFYALKNTKLDFRKKYTEFSQPFYWAPFILYGIFE